MTVEQTAAKWGVSKYVGDFLEEKKIPDHVWLTELPQRVTGKDKRTMWGREKEDLRAGEMRGKEKIYSFYLPTAVLL